VYVSKLEHGPMAAYIHARVPYTRMQAWITHHDNTTTHLRSSMMTHIQAGAPYTHI
jgi:hypothetical protein